MLASRAQSDATIRELRESLAAERKAAEGLRAQISSLSASTKGRAAIHIHLSGKEFVSEHDIRKDLWLGLKRAAELALQYPNASVAESRQTLEKAISSLWHDAGNSGTAPMVSDMLAPIEGRSLDTRPRLAHGQEPILAGERDGP